MNVKRFVARTAREALTHVKQAFGDDAVVLSTTGNVEIYGGSERPGGSGAKSVEPGLALHHTA